MGTDVWSDWSLAPIPGFTGNETRPCATIEARREQDVLGKSLWVYWFEWDEVRGEEVRRPLREVTWAFAGEEEEGWRVGVGGYVARPTEVEGEGGGEGLLEAEFGEGVEIEVLKE